MPIYSKTGEVIKTDYRLHPGELLRDELEARKIKQKDFAADIGISVTQLNEILNAKRIISSELAIMLEAVLKINASIWTSLQAEYDLSIARLNKKVSNKKESIERWAYIKHFINVNYLKKVNVLGENLEANIDKIKTIFHLNEWNELETLEAKAEQHYYRKSTLLNVNKCNLFTWINYAKYKADLVEVPKYHPEKSTELIHKLKELLLKENIIDNTKNTLNKYGIKFLIIDKLEGVNVDGASFCSKKNPTIVMTLRHYRIDNFIFTLFHELGHIVLHIKKDDDLFIDVIDEKKSYGQDRIEDEANDFASNNLIDKTIWIDFIRKNHRFDDEIIENFSSKVNLPPAVIRGRLCNEDLVSYGKKTRIDYKIN